MKKMHLVLLGLCCTLLVGIAYAHEMEYAEDESGKLAAERQYLRNYIIPAIKNIVLSLEVQNAPVPEELHTLIEMGTEPGSHQEVHAFEEEAEHYFGQDWEEQLLADAAKLSAQEAMLLVRSRIYLSSLVMNAESIALKSPLDGEEIREEALALLEELKEVDDEKSHERFFAIFEEAYEEIFPEGSDEDLSSFREEVTALLADVSDAIAILVHQSNRKSLQAELAEIQSRLQLVDDTQKLPAWLARFDAFAENVLSHAVESNFSVLVSDIDALLTNLATYLQELQRSNIETGTFSERVAEMKDDLLLVTSDGELDLYLDALEELLTSVEEAYTVPPEAE